MEPGMSLILLFLGTNYIKDAPFPSAYVFSSHGDIPDYDNDPVSTEQDELWS